MATLLEVEQVIEWLEQRRIKLGGKARKYESKKQNEKIKKISRSSLKKSLLIIKTTSKLLAQKEHGPSIWVFNALFHY